MAAVHVVVVVVVDGCVSGQTRKTVFGECFPAQFKLMSINKVASPTTRAAGDGISGNPLDRLTSVSK